MRVAYIDGQAYAGGTANSVRVSGMIAALDRGGHDIFSLREPVARREGRIGGDPC